MQEQLKKNRGKKLKEDNYIATSAMIKELEVEKRNEEEHE
jgi:hypothetical protein